MLLEQKQQRPVEDNFRVVEKGRTGDPFKDFDMDLAKVVAQDAKVMIKMARDACYEFIDVLYLPDWKFYGKN